MARPQDFDDTDTYDGNTHDLHYDSYDGIQPSIEDWSWMVSVPHPIWGTGFPASTHRRP